MVQWSPSGSVLFALITPGRLKREHVGSPKKTPNAKRFPLHQYLSYNLHSSIEAACFFVDFHADIQNMLRTLMNFVCWYLCPILMRGSHLGTKQANVIPTQAEVVPHPQWTALQQSVCKSHAISSWGTLTLGGSTLCIWLYACADQLGT